MKYRAMVHCRIVYVIRNWVTNYISPGNPPLGQHGSRYEFMGRLGLTTSVRARQTRRMLACWQRSALTLREFREQRAIPLGTLSW